MSIDDDDDEGGGFMRYIMWAGGVVFMLYLWAPDGVTDEVVPAIVGLIGVASDEVRGYVSRAIPAACPEPAGGGIKMQKLG